MGSLVTECGVDCLCREGRTGLFYAPIPARNSIGDKYNIAGLSTGPVVVRKGGALHVANLWFDGVEIVPKGFDVLLLERLTYGFSARGVHD